MNRKSKILYPQLEVEARGSQKWSGDWVRTVSSRVWLASSWRPSYNEGTMDFYS